MSVNLHYRLLIVGEVFDYLLTLRSSERRVAIAACKFLAEHPFTTGDYHETDEEGLVVDIVLKGRFLLTFRADHAVKEMRVIRLEIP